MLCFTGSQCRFLGTDEMWSHLWQRTTSRAEAVCTLYSLLIRQSWMPCRRQFVLSILDMTSEYDTTLDMNLERIRLRINIGLNTRLDRKPHLSCFALYRYITTSSTTMGLSAVTIVRVNSLDEQHSYSF